VQTHPLTIGWQAGERT